MDNEIIEKYYSGIENFKLLGEEVVYFLKKNLKSERIQVSAVTYRIKTLESFIEKTYRKNYKDPFIENTDFLGVRVVFIYKDDLDKIKKIITDGFNIIEESNKVDLLGNDQFGYEAIHYLATIPNNYNGPRYDDIKNTICEIQIRSVLQDAWALVSHHLGYKKESQVPNEIFRKLFALAGTFETIDNQLVQIKHDKENYLTKLRQDIKTSNLKENINLDNLIEYLKNKFPNLKLETSKGVLNNFPSMLKEYNYNTLHDIEILLERTKEARELFNEDETFGKAAARELFIALGLANSKAESEFALDDDIALLRIHRNKVKHKA